MGSAAFLGAGFFAVAANAATARSLRAAARCAARRTPDKLRLVCMAAGARRAEVKADGVELVVKCSAAKKNNFVRKASVEPLTDEQFEFRVRVRG